MPALTENLFIPCIDVAYYSAVTKDVWDVESGGMERQPHESITKVYCC
jgi:hypothetical protein